METWDTLIGQYGRAQLLLAERADQKAAQLRGQIRRLPDRHIGPNSDKAIARHTVRLTEEADVETRQARVCRRRAEYAKRGYLLAGPDERKDRDWLMAYQQGLYLDGLKRGLVYTTTESIDDADSNDVDQSD